MSGISDKALKANYAVNKYRFSGQLYDDDLDWDTYQMKYRTMDPQLGRFWQVDPLANKYVYNSTYAYAEDRVENGIDLEGAEFIDAAGAMAIAHLAAPKTVTEDAVNATVQGQQLANQATAKTVPAVAIAAIGVVQPEIGIPLVMSYLTGLPVSPSPQAFASTMAQDGTAAVNTAESTAEDAAASATSAPEYAEPPSGNPGDASTSAPAKYINSADNFSLSTEQNYSPNVGKALDMFRDLQSNGAVIQPNGLQSNQELNLSIFHEGSQLNLRVETHDLPTKLGGNGQGDPVRHMNVELKPGGKALPNAGHIIL